MRKNLDLFMNKSGTKIVILTLTNQCNLECTYCYEHNKKNLTMDFETAKKIVHYEMTVDDDSKFVCIYYFGGEPFLQFDLIAKIHSYLKSKKWNKGWFAFITTNGTLVHDNIQKWLIDNASTIEVYLSLDGNRKMHNTNRTNSYDLIDVDFFVKEYPFAKMTITEKTLSELTNGIIFLHEKGFEVSANIGYGIDWSEDCPEILTIQLEKLIEYYIEHPEYKPATIMNLAIMDMKPYSDKPKRFCGVGPYMKSYDVDGMVYPCHAFAPLCIGEELADKAEKLDFSCPLELQNLDKKCRQCPVVGVCPTCYGINYGKYKNVYHINDNHCKMMKVQFLANAMFKYRLYKLGRLNLTEQEEYKLLRNIREIQKLAE